MPPKKLTVKEVPVSLDAQHPPSPHNVLPYHEFSMGLIAPKGSGKTTLLINLLAYYAKYFHKIYIFSPTVRNDEKWDWVKRQDLLIENKPLAKWFKNFKEDQGENPIVGKPRGGDALAGPVETAMMAAKNSDGEKFDGKIPEDCFMYEYDEADLARILHDQQLIVEFLHDHGVTKHLADRTLLIFDDLVGSTLFSNARANTFKRVNTNHRHSSFSLMMVSQAFKEIPKTVRTNFSALIIFEIFSEAEIQCIHDEYPMGLKKDQWEQVYRYAVAGDHSFMYYNMQKPRTQRIMRNFDKVLFFKEDEDAAPIQRPSPPPSSPKKSRRRPRQ